MCFICDRLSMSTLTDNVRMMCRIFDRLSMQTLKDKM